MNKYYENLMQTVAEHQMATRKSFAATRYLSKVILNHEGNSSKFRIDDAGIDEAFELSGILEQILDLSSEALPNTRIITAAILLASVSYKDMTEVDFDNGRDDLAAVMAAACSIAEILFLKKIAENSSEDDWEDDDSENALGDTDEDEVEEEDDGTNDESNEDSDKSEEPFESVANSDEELFDSEDMKKLASLDDEQPDPKDSEIQ